MKKEFRRQFLHFFFGSIVILSIILIGTTNFLIANTLILVLGYLISIKIKKGFKLPLIKNFLDYAGRSAEKQIPGKGALTFFIGTLIAGILFYNNQLIFIGAIIPLVFGDSTSTIIGKFFGKIELYKGKTLEGSIAGILISFLFLSVLFSYSTALIAATAGMATEYLPIEDNYTIPIATGIALMLLI
jgi:dolichol kinase